ncbi:MAG: hypothetical protein IPN90_10215 [Elusimicrobia bacterium]|nr:hypothetical protein [Elusimicrobiota bacterium]
MIYVTPLAWHTFFVIFSLLAILVGFVLEIKPLFESARPKPPMTTARVFLWVGTGGLLGSILTGVFLAQKSVVMDGGPWAEHRFLGYWTALVFVGISCARFWMGGRTSVLLVLVWLSALWLLGAQTLGGLRLGGFSLF